MSQCPSCEAPLPNGFSHCRECGTETGWVRFPENPNWWDENHVRDLVSEAEGDNVTYQRLTTKKSGLISRLTSEESLRKRRTANRPIVGYLTPGEVPHYIFTANHSSAARDRAESRYIRQEVSETEAVTSYGYQPIIVFTDERILAIHTVENTDILISVPLDLLVDIEAYYLPDEQPEGLLAPDDSTYIVGVTSTDSKFEFYIDDDYHYGNINSAISLISDLTVISDDISDFTNTVVNSSNDQDGTSNQSSQLNGVVESSILSSIRENRAEVDWEASIKTGLRVGSKVWQYAKVAPYSTPAIVGGATIASTALKAHHTSTGSGRSIDPEELLERGIAGADYGSNFNIKGLGEQKFGVGVGASRYIAERITPEEYQHWVLRTSPETIMKGASTMSQIAENPSVPFDEKTGALIGACSGLIYSYTPEDSPLREIDPENILGNSELTELIGNE